MVRNIKARPPWQGSQAGLYWHPWDSAGQGERGPGGGCCSPLPAARARARGEPAALRGRPKANVVSAVGSVLTRRSGWAGLCPRARRFETSAAASRVVISLVPSRLRRKAPAVPARPQESRQRSARQGPAAVPRRAGPVNVQSGAGKL